MQRTYPTWYSERVLTTDDSATTIVTEAVPSETTLHLVGRVTARRTGGSAGTAEDGFSAEFAATYKNVAGTATLIAATETEQLPDGSINVRTGGTPGSEWSVGFSASSANALIQVVGAVDNNVTWYCEYRKVGINT